MNAPAQQILINGQTVNVVICNYQRPPNLAIVLERENGEGYAVASLNVDEHLDAGEVAIKDYSENEGMLNTLVSAGIVSEPVRWLLCGHVLVPICRLLSRSLETTAPA